MRALHSQFEQRTGELPARGKGHGAPPHSEFRIPHSALRTPHSALRTPHSEFRIGLTLIELLVVIVILVTLVAAAVPILSPSGDDRRIREASRGVNTFFTAAQSKAIQTRRPFGVALKKLSQDTESALDNGVCVELYYVEQPPAFTGFSNTSAVRIGMDLAGQTVRGDQVRIQFVSRGNARPRNSDNLPPGLDNEELPPGVVRRGDVVEAGGTLYELTDDTNDVDSAGFYTRTSGDPNGTLFARPLNVTGQLLNYTYDNEGFPLAVERRSSSSPSQRVPHWTDPMRFKVLRQPMPTSDVPYQLPGGTAIDLRASGVTFDTADPNASGFFYRPETEPGYATDFDSVNNRDSVVMMFTPDGSVERLRLNAAYNPDNLNPSTATGVEAPEIYDQPPPSNIFLLIGRRENIPPPDLTTGTDPTLNTGAMAASALTDVERAELYAPLNWLDTDSRWVVVGSRTGRVVTVENAYVDLRSWSQNTNHTYYSTPSLLHRRALQIAGAREFAREMTRTGGR